MSGKASRHDEVVPNARLWVHGVGFKFNFGVKQYYIVTNDVGEGGNEWSILMRVNLGFK